MKKNGAGEVSSTLLLPRMLMSGLASFFALQKLGGMLG